MAKNKNLTNAKNAKNDEFYTQLHDIENELKHYRKHFKGKVIFCNADDPYESNFFKYFALNFNFLGLKKLITTSYNQGGRGSKVELTDAGDMNYDGAFDLVDIEILLNDGGTLLDGDGDFRSDECIELLKEADIVVTNPPFSLFREYVAQLVEYEKKFLIIGNLNAITYKETFPLLKDNKMWLGYNYVKELIMPAHYPLIGASYVNENGEKVAKFGNILWYTNLTHDKQNNKLVLYKKYTPEEYPHYDNYDAINVDKVTDIPEDWDGVMGVPITFMNKYNPKQFKILGVMASTTVTDYNFGYPYVNGKKKYARILIKRKGDN